MRQHPVAYTRIVHGIAFQVMYSAASPAERKPSLSAFGLNRDASRHTWIAIRRLLLLVILTPAAASQTLSTAVLAITLSIVVHVVGDVHARGCESIA